MDNSPRFCQNCGAALSPRARFCKGCGQPVQPPAAAPVPGVYPQYRQPAPPRRKSNFGCCFGCLGSFLLVALVIAGVFYGWANRPSDMLSLGRRVNIGPQKIASAEGVLTVNDPASLVNGLSIHVPQDAYETRRPFSISTRSIESHKFGPGFNPITPLIHIDNGGEFAADPMTVEVPVQISPDEFAMAFFYDTRSGKLEGIPLLDLTSEKATLLTSHFSDFVITSIPFSELADTEVDSGFAPGVDDWQFVNEGSYIAQGGHCAGQSLTAMWYYYEQYLGAGERRLYGRYDNNNYGIGTIDFQDDDSWGYRWASAVHARQWDRGIGVYRMWGLTSDTLTWYSFAYAMKLTGEPQYVSIGRYLDEDGAQVRKGHALVAYKIEGNHLWVADPNYPGESNRYITFENGAFQPYASGENAIDIAANGVRVYPEIHYIAKTALVDWAKIGLEYQKLLDGKAGEGHFPAYNFTYLAEYDPVTGNASWLPLPDVLELDEADTAKASEPFRGKLVVGINMTPKAYTVFRYDGTQLLENKQSNGQTDVQFIIPLEIGVNELGFGIKNIQDNAIHYNDFRRVKVIYERPDLSGTWEGTWQIENAANFQRYIEKVVVWVLLQTGLAADEAQAREMASSSIEEDSRLYEPRPITVVLTALDPEKLDRYRVEFYLLADDGSITTYNAEATFTNGVFYFLTDPGEDGSAFSFTGSLSGNDSLFGDFNVTAWMVVKDALTGIWQLERQE